MKSTVRVSKSVNRKPGSSPSPANPKPKAKTPALIKPIVKPALPPLLYKPVKQNSLHIWFQFGFPSAINKPSPFKQPLHHSGQYSFNGSSFVQQKPLINVLAESTPVKKDNKENSGDLPNTQQNKEKIDTSGSSEELSVTNSPVKSMNIDQVFWTQNNVPKANIDELIIVEQALFAIEQALKYNMNVAPTCNRWWVVSKIEYAKKLEVFFVMNNMILKELKTFEGMKNALNLAFALETLAIGIIQYMLHDAMNSELIYGSLKTMSILIHSNCMRFLEMVYAHLKSYAPENSAKDVIYAILINRKGIVADLPIAEKAINENNSSIMKIINKVMKFKTGSKLFGYSNPIGGIPKPKNEKTIHNILDAVLRDIDTGSVELSLVRKSVRSISKELPTPVVKQGPISLPNVKSPFLPILKSEDKEKTYTLVLDLDETLVHYAEYRVGGKLLLRPGVQQFLEQMSQYYEIVIYTAAMSDYATWALGMVDKDKKWIKHRLYRQHTVPIGPAFIKDLSKLGRDLSKTIIVDNVPDNFQLQPENGIFIKTWINDTADLALQKLAPVLIEIVKKQCLDVRVALNKFKEQMRDQIAKNAKELVFSLD